MQDQDLIVPVILCGGKGTRLWPLSRSARPKQFLALTGELTLFQKTLQRLGDRRRYCKPVVVTNQDYRFLVAEQALEAGVDLEAILLEPVARNTAAAIAAAAIYVANWDPQTLMNVLSSDHELTIDAAYLTALDTAIAAAQDDRLVTFGITPDAPATGFGYIEAGAMLQSGARAVARFVEKPAIEKAEQMLAAGNYYWNAGMFLFRAGTFLAECAKLAPEVHDAAGAAVAGARADLDFIRLAEHGFSSAPNISVDYAVFEKTDRAAVVPSPIIWSDLGSWDAVWKVNKRDEAGNLARGPVSLSHTTSSLVFTERLHVAVDGLDDVAVVASEDAVYVGRLSAAQSVGEVVKRLESDPDTAVLTESHPTSYRPWGGYTSLIAGERFQVKRIFVKPGKRLSLQKHHHRSEHWVVVRGTAEVQVGEKTLLLSENESAYIPRGDIHRLTNPGRIDLELIEIQTGPYLGEDDIVRLEDEFGRA